MKLPNSVLAAAFESVKLSAGVVVGVATDAVNSGDRFPVLTLVTVPVPGVTVTQLGTPLASRLGATGYFVVSDRHERDLAIARKKQPDLPPATVTVTDVSQFGWPFLFASDPYAPKS